MVSVVSHFITITIPDSVDIRRSILVPVTVCLNSGPDSGIICRERMRIILGPYAIIVHSITESGSVDGLRNVLVYNVTSILSTIMDGSFSRVREVLPTCGAVLTRNNS